MMFSFGIVLLDTTITTISVFLFRVVRSACSSVKGMNELPVSIADFRFIATRKDKKRLFNSPVEDIQQLLIIRVKTW